MRIIEEKKKRLNNLVIERLNVREIDRKQKADARDVKTNCTVHYRQVLLSLRKYNMLITRNLLLTERKQ